MAILKRILTRMKTVTSKGKMRTLRMSIILVRNKTGKKATENVWIHQ